MNEINYNKENLTFSFKLLFYVNVIIFSRKILVFDQIINQRKVY